MSRGSLGSILIAASGVGWLLLFCWWFFGETLPNFHIADTRRFDLLMLLPELLGGNFQQTADSGWHTLPQRFDLMFIAAIILAAAWGLGRIALRKLRLDVVIGSAEAWAVTLGLGLSLWSLVTLGLGVCGVLNRVVFVLAAAAAIVGGVLASRSDLTPVETSSQTASTPLALRLLPWGIVAPFLLAMMLGSMLPSIDFDVKEYHLQGPKEWFQSGRVEMLPHNVYTSFPFLTEMLSLSAMVLRGDWFRGALAGQLVLMTFAPLTALGVYALARRLFSPLAAWCAVVVWLTIPWTLRISVIAYAEGGITCYLLLSTLAAARTLQTTDPALRLRWTLATGLLAGSAASCKYPGVLTVVIPAGVVLTIAAWRQFRSQSLRTVGLYSVGVLATFGPWMLKNTIETGNPVYPLLWSVFGGSNFDAATNVRWEAAHGPPKFLLEQPSRIVPDLLAHGREVALRSDWLSPLLFGLAPLSLLPAFRRRNVLALWGAVAWLFFTWLWLTHRIDRFWIPMLPVVATLSGAGAMVLFESLRNWWRTSPVRIAPAVLMGVVGVTLSVCLLFNLAFATGWWTGYNAYLLDLDAAWRETSATSVTLLRRSGVNEASRVLFVGEAMVFDAEFPCVYNTVFDDSIFQEWFAEPRPDTPAGELPLRPVDDIRRTLEEQRITHVCVHWGEVLRYRLPGSYGFTDFVHPRRFDDLVESGVLERTPYVFTPEWEKLGPLEQAVVLDWAPELRMGSRFRRIEVYRVVR